MYCEATPRDAPRPEPESPRRVPRQSDASRAMKSDGDAAREILDLRARVLEREAALARAIGEKEDAEAAAASALETLNRLRLAREEEVSTRDDTIRALEGRVRELECRDASLTAAREAAEKILTTRAGEADVKTAALTSGNVGVAQAPLSKRARRMKNPSVPKPTRDDGCDDTR